jgi:sortase (surface protein transpeptidase)
VTTRNALTWAGSAIVAALAVVIAVSGGSQQADTAPEPVVQSGEPAGAAGELQDPAASGEETTVTDATADRVQIPAIGVDSGLIPLGLKANSDQLKAPLDFDSAGWFKDGTVPGDIGPAVIDGHIDSPTAPAVFAKLHELEAGDKILVTLSTGDVKSFTVTSSMAAPKDDFPTEEVYGPTPTAQLRVITCDGAIDPDTGKYLDNLVVFADLDA